MKILLGGVPFGRNNIGDEAILEGIVKLIRKVRSDTEITVSTDMPEETEKVLKVKACPLFGFSHVKYDRAEAEQVIKEHDIFIWSGATGLSDYPDDGMEILRMCKTLNTPAVIFGTGMNSELNPAKFTLQAGRKNDILKSLSKLSVNFIDFSAIYEKRAQSTMVNEMKKVLSQVELLVLRNEDSCINLQQKCPNLKVKRGADLALVLEPDNGVFKKIDKHSAYLMGLNRKKVGICISAQRQIGNMSAMAKKLDSWIEKFNVSIFFIPMNPVTDAELMTKLKDQMKNSQYCALVENCVQPSEVVALAAKMDTVISSRLHLLILASISHVPLIGISRGSKVDTFLKRYGILSCGSVESVNLEMMEKQLKYFIENKKIFVLKSAEVRKEMMNDLKLALDMLDSVFKQTEEKIHARSAC